MGLHRQPGLGRGPHPPWRQIQMHAVRAGRELRQLERSREVRQEGGPQRQRTTCRVTARRRSRAAVTARTGGFKVVRDAARVKGLSNAGETIVRISKPAIAQGHDTVADRQNAALKISH